MVQIGKGEGKRDKLQRKNYFSSQREKSSHIKGNILSVASDVTMPTTKAGIRTLKA